MTIQTAIRPAVTAAEQRFLTVYDSVSGKLPGAKLGGVRAWRDAARDAFLAMGVPHRRVEAWKYTDLRVMMPEVYPLDGVESRPGETVDLEAAIGKALADLDCYHAIFQGGRFRADLSTIQTASGVTFTPLRAVLEKNVPAADAVEHLSFERRDVVAAVSTALATDGVSLTVAPGTTLEKPIHLIFISSGETPALSAYLHDIAVGEGAAISLIETHEVPHAQALSHTKLAIGKGTKLKHVRVVGGAAVTHLASADVTLAKDAHYEPVQIAIDSALVRAEANIRFEGENAKCHYAGAMLLRGRGHADFTLVVDHAVPHCESRELVKAVLDGRSRGVFQGKVVVAPGAQKTDGKQMANALLLSDDAEFDSKPELEIFADDVVCGHGATAGQLDEDMMFYLQARGIPEIEARSLLIAAFVGEALDGIDNEALKAALDEKIAGWLTATPSR